MLSKKRSVIESSFNLIIDFYTLFFLSATLLCTFYLIKIYDYQFSEGLLISFLVINVGIRGLIAFFANTYPPTADKIAKKYNWPTDCSLQREVAASEGAFGLLGVLSIWFNGGFWVAVIIGYAFSWITSEVIGIIKIIQGYIVIGKLKTSFPIFAGMCIDLFIAVYMLILVLFLQVQ